MDMAVIIHCISAVYILQKNINIAVFIDHISSGNMSLQK